VDQRGQAFPGQPRRWRERPGRAARRKRSTVARAASVPGSSTLFTVTIWGRAASSSEYARSSSWIACSRRADRGGGRIEVDQVHEHPRALGVAQEAVPEPLALGRPGNQAGEIRDDEALILPARTMPSEGTSVVKRIVGDLGLGRGEPARPAWTCPRWGTRSPPRRPGASARGGSTAPRPPAPGRRGAGRDWSRWRSGIAAPAAGSAGDLEPLPGLGEVASGRRRPLETVLPACTPQHGVEPLAPCRWSLTQPGERLQVARGAAAGAACPLRHLDQSRPAPRRPGAGGRGAVDPPRAEAPGRRGGDRVPQRGQVHAGLALSAAKPRSPTILLRRSCPRSASCGGGGSELRHRGSPRPDSRGGRGQGARAPLPAPHRAHAGGSCT